MHTKQSSTVFFCLFWYILIIFFVLLSFDNSLAWIIRVRILRSLEKLSASWLFPTSCLHFPKSFFLYLSVYLSLCMYFFIRCFQVFGKTPLLPELTHKWNTRSSACQLNEKRWFETVLLGCLIYYLDHILSFCRSDSCTFSFDTLSPFPAVQTSLRSYFVIILCVKRKWYIFWMKNLFRIFF